MTFTLWLLTTLASYRVWRLLGADTVTERARDRLPERLAYPVGCPWCLGSWVTFATFAVTAQFVSLPAPVLQAVAGATVVGLIGTRLDGDG